MSFVDSLDSVLMLYAYASPSRSTTEGKIAIFQKRPLDIDITVGTDHEPRPLLDTQHRSPSNSEIVCVNAEGGGDVVNLAPQAQSIDKKLNVMSSLSITLTALSIIVAIRSALHAHCESTSGCLVLMSSISIIEIMGLIGENCGSCSEAADAEDGGGLAGSWWRFWAKVLLSSIS